MATVRKIISLTDQQNAWITMKVESGRFTNDSELIRDLIRREQERIAEIDNIRAALMDDEQNGEHSHLIFISSKNASFHSTRKINA